MKDRKIKVVFAAFAVVAVGFIATGVLPPLQVCFGAFVGAVVSLSGLYFAGNVLNKKIVPSDVDTSSQS